MMILLFLNKNGALPFPDMIKFQSSQEKRSIIYWLSASDVFDCIDRIEAHNQSFI